MYNLLLDKKRNINIYVKMVRKGYNNQPGTKYVNSPLNLHKHQTTLFTVLKCS